MIDDKEGVGNSSEASTEQQEHPLAKMPPYKEFIKQSETLSTQPDVYSNSLPRTPAIEPVLRGDGSEVHLEPTDLSLKSQERPPILMTDEDLSSRPEQFADSESTVLKGKVKDIMISTFESRVNKQISIDNPDLFEKISDIKDSLYCDPNGEMPSEDEIQARLANALPLLEQYKAVYEQTKQRINDDSRNNRIQKSEEKKIYNLLHEDENDRLKKRRSLYTAYDLSKSKSIPDEYVGLSFEEVKQIEEEKKLATKRSEQSIFRLEEVSETSQVEAGAEKEQTEAFYADLDIPEDEPHFSEAVEIQRIIDWQTFPGEIKTEPIDETDKTGQEVKQALTQIQSFAEYAKENPPDEFDSRNIGADDRLILGDKYNGLVLDYQKAAERRARIGSPELPPALTKKFCHELASIVHEYKEDEEIWRLIGERSLEDAFDAYADIKGIDAVVKDFGKEIPEQIDRYTVLPLISKINDVVRQDWQRRITPVESYAQGQSYSFLCSRVKEPFSAQESRNNIFSCSLLTDSHHETIGDSGSFGFIFPPDHIIAAAPHDIYTHNWSDDDESSLRSGVPIVMSYDRVLRESQEDKTYSEITTRDLPTGIFYLKNKIDEEGHQKLAELIRINPGLPIIAL